MKVDVLQVRRSPKGLNVAHVKCGQLFGDVLATDDVTEPGEYEMKVTLRVVQGRLVPLIRVENK